MNIYHLTTQDIGSYIKQRLNIKFDYVRMDIGLRLIKVLMFFILTFLFSCQGKNNSLKEVDSYQIIDLYIVPDEYKFYALYFKSSNEGCILAYKVAGNPVNSDIQMFFNFFNKNLNKEVFPVLENGYILIDNEFKTDFRELKYISETDSILSLNYNKKIQRIEIERNNSIKIHITDKTR